MYEGARLTEKLILNTANLTHVSYPCWDQATKESRNDELFSIKEAGLLCSVSSIFSRSVHLLVRSRDAIVEKG